MRAHAAASTSRSSGRRVILVLVAVVVVAGAAVAVWRVRSAQSAATREKQATVIKQFLEGYSQGNVGGMATACHSRYATFFQQMKQLPPEQLTVLLRGAGASVGEVMVEKTEYDASGTARVTCSAMGSTYLVTLAKEAGQWKITGLGGLTVDAWFTD